MSCTKCRKLRHRVTLQRKGRTSDGMGGFVEGWTDVATVYARVEPLKGRERYAAQQVHPELSHRVTIRYRNDVTANDMRVRYGSRYLYIRAAINEDGANRYLRLECVEGAES